MLPIRYITTLFMLRMENIIEAYIIMILSLYTVDNLPFKRGLVRTLGLRRDASKMTSLAVLPVNQSRMSSNTVLKTQKG